MRKQIILTCPVCNIPYSKDLSEYKRNLKLNRRSYCSLKCTGIDNFSNIPDDLKNTYDIAQHSNNKLDEYSKFRWYLKTIKSRKNKYSDITLKDLEYIWNKQNGICPYTKIQLKLTSHTTIMTNQPDIFHYASIDRIDNFKGYIKDNIEFISVGINFMKNKFTKDQVIDFLTLISLNLKG